jgi:uncharacterized membrane protein
MAEDPEDRFVCQICHEAKPADEVLPARMVRGGVAETIRKEHPEWSDDGYICLSDLNRYRMERVRQVVTEEMGGLTEVETEVVQSLADQDILSRNTNVEFEGARTYGERVSDHIASFGGSWPFIFTFGGVLVTWIAINSVGLLRAPFDPYPYILLNLLLSCLAAIQAPIIMMSQNRQEARDRLRSEHDYQVNLKAELEIRSLSARIDELLRHQWQGLLEIQQVQTEMMEELARKTAPTSDR